MLLSLSTTSLLVFLGHAGGHILITGCVDKTSLLFQSGAVDPGLSLVHYRKHALVDRIDSV